MIKPMSDTYKVLAVHHLATHSIKRVHIIGESETTKKRVFIEIFSETDAYDIATVVIVGDRIKHEVQSKVFGVKIYLEILEPNRY